MAEPKWLQVARRYEGEREIAGKKHNPKIVEFFRRVTGQAQTDETAWCAAFVGYCLAEAGLPNTGKLTARSYLQYGEPLEEPKLGAITVFKRGSSSWQGHVAFFLRDLGSKVEVFGGNQGNRVCVAAYAKRDLLGYRWPIAVKREAGEPPHDLLSVQRRLKDLGYHEVGKLDGLMGNRTRTALYAFKDNEGLPINADLDDATIRALFVTAKARPIDPERATGAPIDSKIVKNSNRSITTGAVAVGTGIVSGAKPLLDQAQDTTGVVGQAVSVLRDLSDIVGPWLPYIMVAVGAGVMIFAGRALLTRLKDHREGRTP
ncbi:uncharacterized protein (TIGR02594 family) [Rhodoligotrophos appendicifer]|uniref:C40 family peptidase n=1 Tax=Rhodoligotrophos appendicifer TaxID=987056 RepID=UPI0011855987|nr:TIGR02594 family protein [Rhodoligotrophos appendicifer]